MDKEVVIRKEGTYKLTAIIKNSFARCFTVSDNRDGEIEEKTFFPDNPLYSEIFNILSKTNYFQSECRDILY